jgi:hypothetical protein
VAKSTGPLLAAGAVRIGNDVIVNGQDIDWKMPLGIGVVAAIFAGLEHIPGLDVFIAGIAWIALVTMLLTRSSGKPSPAENFAKFVGW